MKTLHLNLKKKWINKYFVGKLGEILSTINCEKKL